MGELNMYDTTGKLIYIDTPIIVPLIEEAPTYWILKEYVDFESIIINTELKNCSKLILKITSDDSSKIVDTKGIRTNSIDQGEGILYFDIFINTYNNQTLFMLDITKNYHTLIQILTVEKALGIQLCIVGGIL